jgi:hypothetical protein
MDGGWIDRWIEYEKMDGGWTKGWTKGWRMGGWMIRWMDG